MRLEREEAGFGMVVQSDGCLSGYAFPNGAAERAGMPIGAKILKVNGQSVPNKKALMNNIKFGGPVVEFCYRLPDEHKAANVQCRAGHVLKRDLRIQHTCDLCTRKGTHYGCPKGCDYDLCGTCYDKLFENGPLPHRTASAYISCLWR